MWCMAQTRAPARSPSLAPNQALLTPPPHTPEATFLPPARHTPSSLTFVTKCPFPKVPCLLPCSWVSPGKLRFILPGLLPPATAGGRCLSSPPLAASRIPPGTHSARLTAHCHGPSPWPSPPHRGRGLCSLRHFFAGASHGTGNGLRLYRMLVTLLPSAWLAACPFSGSRCSLCPKGWELPCELQKPGGS